MEPLSDTDFLSRFIGTNIKITTIHGHFQGELFHIDTARAIILIKVIDLSTGKTVPGAKLFLGHVILKVETQEDPSYHDGQEQDEPPDESGNMVSEDKAKSALKPEVVDATAPKNVKESDVQIPNYSGDEDINYILIDQFQPMFGPAIMHLQNQKVLGLAAVALNVSCHGKLCLLQIATKTRVYIFDIFLLGPKVFKNGLQMVLEDKGILKVVHDCRWLGNFLFHKYSVVLANVFDTQVADVYVFSIETGGFLPNHTSTVTECLTRYLNLSSSKVSYLTYKQTIMKDNPNIWCNRPLQTAALKLLSLEVLQLLALRLAMLDAMLADFTLLVDGYLTGYCHQASDMFLSAEKDASSEIPKELQQICVLQQRRREKALRLYQVTPQGHLIREDM
ncbi:piRNA biogenesis protein EXD1 isoform 2-T5 [Anomaloglossus baeobatrachus]|uniref:piRNA biogenesis protein EXD1 isoform X2 n=1 Tax=Anomaloglossus baeobatrachus TaxID=238106 RepID=UPI003F500539